MLGMAMAWHAGYDIVHMLLDAGAGVEPIGTPFNNPIDHLSPEGGRRRPACIPEENVKVAHRVCSRIKDINAPLWGKNGWALRKYVYMRHLDIAEVLVEHGADMGQANVERKDGVLVEAGPVEHVPDPNGWDEQYFRDHRWQYVPVEQHLDWVRPEDEDDYL